MDRTKALAGLIVAIRRLPPLHILLLGSCLLGSCLLGNCRRQPAALVVGSKNFTESALLGELLAQHIERRLGLKVERKLNLGGTLLAHQALTSGAIDLYPEYTGTALTAVLKRPPVNDPPAVLSQVREAYQARWRLDWLRPLGFNNTFAMIVRGETARREKLATLSEAAGAQAWKLGVGYEFTQRPDGLPGLLKTYNLRTAGGPISMDLGLLYAALKTRRVDLIAASSTDGLISVLDVAVLEDDRHYFPPYECAVIVRQDTQTKYPGLRVALEQLSGMLTDRVMRRLNFGVDGEHRPPAQVASRFLDSAFAARR
jgi:glycine betaine/choline ABC-type transport system substrate-binding protein